MDIAARDYRGGVLHLGATQVNIFTIKAVEATTIVVALQLALAKGWNFICVESDAQSMVNRLINLDFMALTHWESSNYTHTCLQLRPLFTTCSFA